MQLPPSLLGWGRRLSIFRTKPFPLFANSQGALTHLLSSRNCDEPDLDYHFAFDETPLHSLKFLLPLLLIFSKNFSIFLLLTHLKVNVTAPSPPPSPPPGHSTQHYITTYKTILCEHDKLHSVLVYKLRQEGRILELLSSNFLSSPEI